VVSSGRHPKNAINAVLASLDLSKFEVIEIHKGHRWGVVCCLTCGSTQAVWSTPRVPENNAKDIRQFVNQHQH